MFVHIDLDSFFANAELLRNPSLKGRVVVVCMFTPRGGAVSTVNYEGRKYGIHSGMSLKEAKRRAPKDAVFLKADKLYYASLSFRVDEIIKSIFKESVQVSIDEWNCVGDVEEARRAKDEIEKLGLSASIGVAPSVLGAKLAANAQKPSGFVVWNEKEEREYIDECEVEKIPGIGKKTAEALAAISVKKVKDLRKKDPVLLIELFGKKSGAMLNALAHGDYSKELGEEGLGEISTLTTLPSSTRDYNVLLDGFLSLTEKLKQRLKALNMGFRTLSLIVITEDFETHYKSKRFALLTPSADIKREIAFLLNALLSSVSAPIRRIGVKFGDLEDLGGQQTLF